MSNLLGAFAFGLVVLGTVICIALRRPGDRPGALPPPYPRRKD